MVENALVTGIISEETAGEVARLFEALSDPTRVRIIAAICQGEVSVNDLANQVGLTKSAISHQLRHLRDRRIVRARKSGRQVFYSLDDEHVADLFQRGLEHTLHR